MLGSVLQWQLTRAAPGHTGGHRIKIIDFGMARCIADQAVDKTYYVCTRYYRALEVLVTKAGYDNRIDIWSAGQ